MYKLIPFIAIQASGSRFSLYMYSISSREMEAVEALFKK